MKIVLLNSLVFAVAYCKLITVRKGDDTLWQEYKNYFDKQYTDLENALKRPIFEDAIQNIWKHNKGFHRGEHSYSQGLNHFSDMTQDEINDMASNLENQMECNSKSLLYSPPSDHPIPDGIDWNEKGYVTRVLNQGKCGACWAFCAAAALEGQMKRRTGKLIKLSEQQLMDCSTITGNKKCGGGQMCRAYEAAVDQGGVDTEEFYPYEDQPGECRFSPDKIGAPIKGYLEIPYGDEHALLMAVALIGPVAAGLDGYRPAFRHYKSGIYDDPGCSNTTLNHALTVTGYGTENGKDYWLVKNSWSTRWGMDGFAKMVRNKHNQCGLASRAIFPVLNAGPDGKPQLLGPAAGVL